MAVSRRHADSGIPWWSGAAIATAAISTLVAVGGAALTLVVARTVVTPPRRQSDDVALLAVDAAGALVTLELTEETAVPGVYGLFFSNGAGYARIGQILARGTATVTRRLLDIDHGDLAAARRGRLSGWFYLDPAELGYPFENVSIETEVGPAPAWLIPAAEPSGRWVIQVHGRAVTRAETLRAVPVFRSAGFTSLVISYRNDVEAPRSPDGRYGLGDTEWHDVESAIAYAVRSGATDVILMGWSMGGAMALQAATRSTRASVVRGVVLESPVVDWVSALRYQGGLRRLPTVVRSAVISLIGRQWAGRLTGQREPIDFRRLDFVHRAAELTLPILLMHSVDDHFIPVDASRALAEARPDIVTYEEFSEAGHTRLWNYDPDRFTGAISTWLVAAGLVANGPARVERG